MSAPSRSDRRVGQTWRYCLGLKRLFAFVMPFRHQQRCLACAGLWSVRRNRRHRSPKFLLFDFWQASPLRTSRSLLVHYMFLPYRLVALLADRFRTVRGMGCSSVGSRSARCNKRGTAVYEAYRAARPCFGLHMSEPEGRVMMCLRFSMFFSWSLRRLYRGQQVPSTLTVG